MDDPDWDPASDTCIRWRRFINNFIHFFFSFYRKVKYLYTYTFFNCSITVLVVYLNRVRVYFGQVLVALEWTVLN